MKSLYYLLITTLLTVTSYGADKVVPGTGWEGWGESGYSITFHNYDNIFTPAEIKSAESQVESKLKTIGLDKKDGSSFSIQIYPMFIRSSAGQGLCLDGMFSLVESANGKLKMVRGFLVG